MEISFNEILDLKASREEKLTQIAEKIRKGKAYSWVGIYDIGEKEISIIS